MLLLLIWSQKSQSFLLNLSAFFFIYSIYFTFFYVLLFGSILQPPQFKKFILSAFSNFSLDDWYSPGFNFLSACMLTNSSVVEFVGILSSEVQREERKIVVSCFSKKTWEPAWVCSFRSHAVAVKNCTKNYETCAQMCTCTTSLVCHY